MPRARTGTWRQEPRVVLPHALARCDFSPTPRRACDASLARAVAVITPRVEPAPAACGPVGAATPPRRPPPAHSNNAPAVNTRAHIRRIPGVALGTGHGRRDALAQTLLAEMGTALRPGPADNHCCSWLGLAPKNDLAGGQRRKRRPLLNRNRAAPAFRRAAQSLLRADGAVGAFSRR